MVGFFNYILINGEQKNNFVIKGGHDCGCLVYPHKLVILGDDLIKLKIHNL
jgi:hypothetical protein